MSSESPSEDLFDDGPPPSGRSAERTFLFIDVEGSTGLIERIGAGYASLLEAFFGTVRREVLRHRGEMVSTQGDGAFCIFDEPANAAAAGVEIQRALARHPWPEAGEVRARIGIHAGTVEVTPDGHVGLDVHRAARIAGAGHGGQILLSLETRRLVEEEAGRRGWGFRDLGSFELRGLSRPEPLVQLQAPGLVSEFPPVAARASARLHLPVPATPLLGRDDDVAEIRRSLAGPAVRMLTLTGPAGAGKTRVALEVARLVQAEFPDGVHFLDFSDVRDPTLVIGSVGRALGILDAAGRSIPEAAEAALGRARLLLVLDNMEQLVDAAPELGHLLARVPGIKMLVTSREPLRLRWEHEVPVRPLPVPDADASWDALMRVPSVRLLVERARSVVPGFSVTAGNAAALARIARRLDGLPLAIELAAARLRSLTPEALLERLDRRLDLLRTEARDSPERHRTLREAVLWSHDLLSPEEQAVFRRVGVFYGGWEIGAAAAVCSPGEADEAAVLDALDDLVRKSMVGFYPDDGGRSRYRLLETLHEFSLECLRDSGEEPEVRRRHREWYLGVARRIHAEAATARFPEALDEAERERHNMRAVLDWTLATRSGVEEALSLAGLLWLFWDVRGFASEGLRWLGRLLAMPEAAAPTPGRARALEASGWLLALSGELTRADERLAEAGRIWETADDPAGLAWSRSLHGMVTYNLGDLERSRALFESSTELARGIGDAWLAEGWNHYGLGHVAMARGDLASASELVGRTLGYSRRHGLVWGVGHAQFSLGVMAFMRGDLAEATARLEESLRTRQGMRDVRGIADCIGMLALLAADSERFEAAARLLGAAETQRRAAGQEAAGWQRPFLSRSTALARDRLGGEEFERLLAEGRSLPPDAALALAVGARPGA
jgi:predicted ATPase/class 3 adenylate cyclase